MCLASLRRSRREAFFWHPVGREKPALPSGLCSMIWGNLGCGFPGGIKVAVL